MIDTSEIKRIAELARLYLDDEEIGALTEDLNQIVEFAGTISAVEIEPFSEKKGYALDSLREDIVSESYSVADILQNAALRDDNFFIVEVRKNG